MLAAHAAQTRMEYIETELKARRAKAIAEGTASASAPQPSTEEAIASLDPRDELYRIAEKYRIDKKPVVEGNVTLSAAMLTAVPEVDLGIECVPILSCQVLGC